VAEVVRALLFLLKEQNKSECRRNAMADMAVLLCRWSQFGFLGELHSYYPHMYCTNIHGRKRKDSMPRDVEEIAQ
jgi:hypothetical protein